MVAKLQREIGCNGQGLAVSRVEFSKGRDLFLCWRANAEMVVLGIDLLILARIRRPPFNIHPIITCDVIALAGETTNDRLGRLGNDNAAAKILADDILPEDRAGGIHNGDPATKICRIV